MEEKTHKKVDTAWKEKVQREKKELSAQKEIALEVNFTNFVNGLGLECLIALGKLENPFTKKKEKNLQQAKYIIDTLDMLKSKTEGNLLPMEKKNLEELITYLKFSYVEESK